MGDFNNGMIAGGASILIGYYAFAGGATDIAVLGCFLGLVASVSIINFILPR